MINWNPNYKTCFYGLYKNKYDGTGPVLKKAASSFGGFNSTPIPANNVIPPFYHNYSFLDPDHRYSLSGRVINQFGEPMKNLSVFANYEILGPGQFAYTNGNGEFVMYRDDIHKFTNFGFRVPGSDNYLYGYEIEEFNGYYAVDKDQSGFTFNVSQFKLESQSFFEDYLFLITPTNPQRLLQSSTH